MMVLQFLPQLRDRLTARPTRITSEMLKKLHKEERPSLIRFMDVDGGGYLGTLEFTHQLHCLVCSLPEVWY